VPVLTSTVPPALLAGSRTGATDRSSRMLVWGAVEIAGAVGISDLIIGLTIVAVGTSLPELASSMIAARKGEHDIALGNILGSNLFNTLAVVGIAGVISPLAVGREVLSRDMLVMSSLTLLLFVLGFGFRGPGRINRIEGAVVLAIYGVIRPSWLSRSSVCSPLHVRSPKFAARAGAIRCGWGRAARLRRTRLECERFARSLG